MESACSLVLADASKLPGLGSITYSHRDADQTGHRTNSVKLGSYSAISSVSNDGDTITPLPGCGFLGSSYDVLNGYYADSRSCHFNLFDFPDASEMVNVGSVMFTKPKAITCHTNYGVSLSTSSGSDISEYIKSINSTTKIEGSYNFFSASIEAEIGISSAQKSENLFSKVQSVVRLFTLELPPHHVKLLKESVKEDIENMDDLTELFDLYGTHYLASLVMGGVANYTSSTNKRSFVSEHDIAVVAQMSFKFLTKGLSAEENFKYKDEIKSFVNSSNTLLQTAGGDPALAGENFPEHVSEWTKSVGDYMALVDFNGHRSLLGIWELASDSERKKKIHDFYGEYCKIRGKMYEVKYPAVPFDPFHNLHGL